LLPVAPNPSSPNQPAIRGDEQLAPLWHTAVVLFILLGASLEGSRALHPMAAHHKIAQYLWTMTWEWLLTGFVFLGIRKRAGLRELIGGRWGRTEDFVRDLGIALAFWLVAVSVLSVGAHLMHLDQAGRVEDMQRQLGFLIPSTTLELVVWCLLSATAGFCEEVIFRGYLQRQFGAMTRSIAAGVVLSAIAFGASHGYEGGPRMVLLAIFGLMFGLLALWRKSLRPGMIAHAWHDAFSGAVLRLVK
jgi:membrane protease YdiL (CAAX protease family)